MQRLSCRADARRAAVPGAAAEPGADTRAALHRYLAVLERRYGDASTTASRDGGSTRPASARAAPSAEAALGLGFSRQFHALAARMGDERRHAGRRARGARLRQPACRALTDGAAQTRRHVLACHEAEQRPGRPLWFACTVADWLAGLLLIDPAPFRMLR